MQQPRQSVPFHHPTSADVRCRFGSGYNRHRQASPVRPQTRQVGRHPGDASRNDATRARRSRSRRRKALNLPNTAFPALRPLGPSRAPLSRGRADPLDGEDRNLALRDVVRGVYADSTHKPMAPKMRTNRMFLACWNLPLVPYTVDVVYALGASLKWRKYRSAEDYLFQSKVVAEREAAHISQATHRALTDVICTCKRGLGPPSTVRASCWKSCPTCQQRMRPGHPADHGGRGTR